MLTVSVESIAGAIVLCTMHLLGGVLLGAYFGKRSVSRASASLDREAQVVQSIVDDLRKSLDTCRTHTFDQLNRVQAIVNTEMERLLKTIDDQDARGRVTGAVEQFWRSAQDIRGIFDSSAEAISISTERLATIRAETHRNLPRPARPDFLTPKSTDLPPPKPGLGGQERRPRRLPFHCTQYYVEWDGDGTPPVEAFRPTQCLEISTEEIVLAFPVPPRGDSLFIGLGTPPELVLLKAMVTHCQQLGQATGAVYQITCKFIKRYGRATAAFPIERVQPAEMSFASASSVAGEPV